jgi:hypothetical protein
MKTSLTMLLSRLAVLLGLAAIAITVSPLTAQSSMPVARCACTESAWQVRPYRLYQLLRRGVTGAHKF